MGQPRTIWIPQSLCLCVALLAWTGSIRFAAADPTQFWFSLSDSDPYQFFASGPSGTAPGVPRIELGFGETRTFFMWGRPQTVNSGQPYDVDDNPFRQLVNMSFNLNVPDSDPSVLMDSVVIENPQNKRFGVVVDSVHTIDLDLGGGDTETFPEFSRTGVKRFAGFTLTLPQPLSGIGGNISPNPTAGGVPAWLLATFTATGQAPGESDGWLQVGGMSITHADEPTTDPSKRTQVVFGDSAHSVPYDAAIYREVTFDSDAPDVLFFVQSGDFTGDGAVDGKDLLVWQRNNGRSIGTPGFAGDGNGDGKVDANDLAIWRAQYGRRLPGQIALATPAGVPEPSAGWLGIGCLIAVLSSRRRMKRLRQLVVVGLSALPITSEAAQLTAVWTGFGALEWEDPGSWDILSVPNNSVDTYAVAIGIVGSPPPALTLSSDVTIDSLALNRALSIDANRLQVLTPITVFSSGSINLGPAAELDASVILSSAATTMIMQGNRTFDNHAITLAGSGSTLNVTSESLFDLGIDGAIVLSGGGATFNSIAPATQNRGTIRAQSSGSRTVNVDGFNNQGLIEAAGGTLTINTLNTFANSGVLRTSAGATLAIFPAAPFTHTGTAELQGSGTFRIDSNADGNVNAADIFVNEAVVRPGNSPGIMTIEGNYQQTVDGLLEIEIGGTTPGTQHDQLVVTGSASLRGRLDMPIINGFVPAVGQSATLLLAQSGVGVAGRFDSYRVTNLPTAVAQKLVYNSNDVRVDFVQPVNATYSSTAPFNVYGGSAADWGGSLPDSASVVDISNNLGGALEQFVLVNTYLPALPFRNMAHSMSIGGAAGPVSVLVNGTELSVSTTTTVKDQGKLVLYSGSVVSSDSVLVQDGGRLEGTGSLLADVTIGSAAGGVAVFNPVGSVTIDGDYAQQATGRFDAAIFGAADVNASGNDQLLVSGDVTLAGALRIDVSGLSVGEITPLATYELIAFDGARTGKFDRVEVVGRDDIYFAVSYDTPPAPGPVSAALTGGLQQYGVYGQLFWRGDGDQDGDVDSTDAEIFAKVLLDDTIPGFYVGSVFAGANFLDAFDFYPHRGEEPRIDFYDVAGFADAYSRFQGVALSEAYDSIDAAIALVQSQAAVPEPTTASLLAACFLLALASRGPLCRN